MWSVANVSGVNGMPLVRISSNATRASADIYFFGATLTSWNDKNGVENIFVSSKAIFNGVKAIRGGIPVVFPQFGQPSMTMPQHGFARTSHWSFESSKLEDESVAVTFSLTDNEATFALWPYKFRLEYTIKISPENLTCNLRVNNVGSSDFAVHTLLHTYLKIQAIQDIAVRGFQNQSFVDKVANSQSDFDARAVAHVVGEVDRVMTGNLETPMTAVTLDTGVSGGQRCVTLVASASLTDTDGTFRACPHDIVFWNPWIEKARALADLGDEDYLNFVCLEPGTTSKYVTVAPGCALILCQTLSSTSS